MEQKVELIDYAEGYADIINKIEEQWGIWCTGDISIQMTGVKNVAQSLVNVLM